MSADTAVHGTPDDRIDPNTLNLMGDFHGRSPDFGAGPHRKFTTCASGRSHAISSRSSVGIREGQVPKWTGRGPGKAARSTSQRLSMRWRNWSTARSSLPITAIRLDTNCSKSTREYALDQLRASDELHEAQHRHAKAIWQRFQGGEECLWVTSDVAWRASCAPELGNLRAALEWSKQHDMPLALALAGSSMHSFTMMGLMHEHRRRSAELAAHLPPNVEPAVLAGFWLGRAWSLALSNCREMRECASKAADFQRQSGSARGLYLSLCYWALAGTAPQDECRHLLDELTALEDPHWPPRLRAYRKLAECTVAMYANDPAGQQVAAKAGLALAKLAGADRSAAVFEVQILRSDLTLGNVEAALSRGRDLVAHERRRGGLLNVSLAYQAVALLTAGDLLQARAVIAEFFDCCRSAEWEAFDDFAGIPIRLTLAEQRHTSAARLVGYFDKAKHRLGLEAPFSKALRTRALAAFEGHLNEGTVQELIAEGHQLREEDVCALTLETGK